MTHPLLTFCAPLFFFSCFAVTSSCFASLDLSEPFPFCPCSSGFFCSLWFFTLSVCAARFCSFDFSAFCVLSARLVCDLLHPPPPRPPATHLSLICSLWLHGLVLHDVCHLTDTGNIQHPPPLFYSPSPLCLLSAGEVLFQMAEVHRQIQIQLEEMVSMWPSCWCC